VWTNDSFLALGTVCSLLAEEQISAFVLLYPGPVLEAVASTLYHLGLPLLIVDLSTSAQSPLLLNFAPAPHSLGRALADLLAAESMTSPHVFYTDYRQLPTFHSLVTAAGVVGSSARLMKVEPGWKLARRLGDATEAVVVLLACSTRAEGLAFLEAALLAGWLGRGTRVVLPCLELHPADIGKYEAVGALIYLVYLDTSHGDGQRLTSLLTEDILTGLRLCYT
jgi:hypothetical protein